MPRRFNNPKVTKWGRIGHPAPLDRKLVRCAGVTFEDRHEGKMWTLRMYEAYSRDWPEVDVWTVQVLVPVRQQGRFTKTSGYGPQTKVEDADVPDEVRAFALAELVRLRLKGVIRA